jgi:threonine dehydrogenase-like Zn-dependent dehydrogenase
VLIFGSSERSLIGIVLARCLGAECILVAGLPGEDPSAALRCGATKFLTPEENSEHGSRWPALLSEAKECSGGRGVDVVLYPGELIGGLPLLGIALACVRQGGCVVTLIGWADVTSEAEPDGGRTKSQHLEGLEAALATKDVRMINVAGSSSSIFEQTLRWIESGLLDLSGLVTNVLPLQAWEEAHRLAKRRGPFVGCVLKRVPHSDPE